MNTIWSQPKITLTVSDLNQTAFWPLPLCLPTTTSKIQDGGKGASWHPRMGKPMPSPAMSTAGAPVLKSQVGGQHHRSYLPALLPHWPLVAARDLLRPAAPLQSPQHPWEGLTWAAPVWGCGSSWSHSCATGGLPHDAGPPHPRLPGQAAVGGLQRDGLAAPAAFSAAHPQTPPWLLQDVASRISRAHSSFKSSLRFKTIKFVLIYLKISMLSTKRHIFSFH